MKGLFPTDMGSGPWGLKPKFRAISLFTPAPSIEIASLVLSLHLLETMLRTSGAFHSASFQTLIPEPLNEQMLLSTIQFWTLFSAIPCKFSMQQFPTTVT